MPSQSSFSRKLTLHGLYPTIAGSLLFAILASQRHAGFILHYVAPCFFPPLMLYIAYIAIRRPQQRQLQNRKALIWLTGVFAACVIQMYMFFAAQYDGLKVSSAVDAYIAANGHCPKSMEEIGFETSDDRLHGRRANFDCYDGKPNLWYFSTFLALDMEQYDFHAHRWYHIDVDLD